METLISKTDLLSRYGWSETAIKKFYPVHDVEKRNPISKKLPPMKLYSLEKVVEIEQTSEFGLSALKVDENKQRAKKSVKTKETKLMDYINSLTIEVPTIDKDELILRACTHKNSWYEQQRDKGIIFKNEDGHFEIREFIDIHPNSDKETIARIVTNFLRHELSIYEKELVKIIGKTGKHEAYKVLKSKVNEAIWKKYTWASEYEKNEEYEGY